MTEYRLIPLTGKRGVGKFAKVSAEDYEAFSRRSWHVSPDGYPRASITVSKGEKRQTKMHHLVLPLQGDGLEVDHINRDKLDNRRDNLRYVTRRENILNSDNPFAKRMRGEAFEHKRPFYKLWFCNTYHKWRAYIQTDVKRIYVGSSVDREQLEVFCVERLEKIKLLSAV